MKFRIWNKQLQKFVNYDEWYINGQGEVFFLDIMDNDLVKGDPSNVTVQRFTELYDKSGTPLFEGDIVEHGSLDQRYPITYRFGRWMVGESSSLHDFWVDNTRIGDICDVNLVGNIFEK